MQAAPVISIPNITEDSLRTPESAYEAAMQICEASRRATILLETHTLAPMSKVRGAARKWIEDIEPRIDSYTSGQGLRLAHAYDHLHRLAYGSAPLPGTVERQVFRALDSAIHGDHDIDQYLLFRLITLGLNRGIKEYHLLPLRWQSQKLAGWYKKYKNILNSTEPHLDSFRNNPGQQPGSFLNKISTEQPDNFRKQTGQQPGSFRNSIRHRCAEEFQAEESEAEEIAILLASDLTPFTGRNQAPFKNRLRALLK